MFVCFSFLSFGLFAPTILLPLVREHCELLAEESRLKQIRVDLTGEIDRRDSLMEAFSNDPTIVERLAVLDLNYQRPHEEVLPVLPKGYVATVPDSEVSPVFRGDLQIPADWPGGVQRVEHWAERHGLIDLFLDGSLRPALLFMSGGLIIAAFVLFSPWGFERRTHGSPRRSPSTYEAAGTHPST